jgi:hypothetical protein
MRLWSLHPEYLYDKGLVALWREGLLGLAVIRGSAGGYRNHPQLKRFLNQKNPVATLESHFWAVYREAAARAYSSHVRRKLSLRDTTQYQVLKELKEPKPHPLFRTVSGNVERWEVAYYRAT